MWVQADTFTQEQLQRFRTLQRQVFATLERVAATLEPGISEKEATRELRREFRGQGVTTYFHVPVALFGERTTYPGDFGELGALPTDRVLREDDALIVDAAPLLDGFMIDCSLAVPRPGADTATFREADALLAHCRTHILERARERANMREVAREIDVLIREAGFENCHKKHIGKVLGHRVTRSLGGWLGGQRIWGLAPLPVSYFFAYSFVAANAAASFTPNWNATRQSDCPLQSGIWAVEPHVARGETGAKFEEMLVVTDDDAFWLDDELPHHRRWAAAAA
ncbi:MAG TPA: M24 family metallopeptidase [Candidatus Binatia bacterium]|jgi:Xaa-Pro aminopeptidase